MTTRRPKGRKRKDAVEENRFPFLIKKYMEIKTIDIKLTLKSGEVVIVRRDRDFIDDKIVLREHGRERIIPVSEVLKADLFAA